MKSIPFHVSVALAVAASAVATPASGHDLERHQAASRGGVAQPEQTDWGIAGRAQAARRTIRITMTDDLRFTPAIVEVGQGETVKFEVRNAGRMLHEMVIGTKARLAEHAALMRKYPGMEHEEPYMTHVRPGRSGAIVWTFNRPGEFAFACLVAGHYEAGMAGTIRVVEHAGHKE